MIEAILGFLLLAGIIAALGAYYWTRVIAVGLLLLLWFAVAVGAPLGLALLAFSRGEALAALITFAVGIIPAFLWYMTATFAWKWIEREERLFGGFWKKWNAR